jgi:hypothetical protein
LRENSLPPGLTRGWSEAPDEGVLSSHALGFRFNSVIKVKPNPALSVGRECRFPKNMRACSSATIRQPN